jgi:hypothetical protein
LFVVEKVQLLQTAQDRLYLIILSLGTELSLDFTATVGAPGEKASRLPKELFG